MTREAPSRNAQRAWTWDQTCDWYWVLDSERRMPEFKQLESAKSMMRNLPREGHAGLAAGRERAQARAAATGEQHGERLPRELPMVERSGCVRAAPCRLGRDSGRASIVPPIGFRSCLSLSR